MPALTETMFLAATCGVAAVAVLTVLLLVLVVARLAPWPGQAEPFAMWSAPGRAQAQIAAAWLAGSLALGCGARLLDAVYLQLATHVRLSDAAAAFTADTATAILACLLGVLAPLHVHVRLTLRIVALGEGHGLTTTAAQHFDTALRAEGART